MGLFLSVEDSARKDIASNIQKSDIQQLDIDKLFEDAYHAQPIPYYNSFAFAKKRGDENIIEDTVIRSIESPSRLNIDRNKIIEFIQININDTQKIWKALNLIGYYENLEAFVNMLPTDLKEKCKSILLSYFERREGMYIISLLGASNFAFLYH